MKQTGQPWLPRIPQHWELVPASALFRARNEPNHPDDVHLTPSQKYGVLPQSTYMQRTGSRVVLNLTGADNMKHVEPGDVISHLRSFQGGLETSDLVGKVSMAYTVIRPRQELVTNYYRHLFKSDRYVQALRVTTNQLRDGQSIRFAELRQISLPVPPLDEQRAIAEHLDREVAQIDELMEKQTTLIDRLRERRQLTIDAALTEGLTVPLRRDLAFLTSGPRGWGEFYADEGDIFIRITNLHRGRYDLKTLDVQHVQLPGLVEGSRARTKMGDLLFSITAYLGSVAVVPDAFQGAYVSQHVALARLRGRLWLPEFVAYAVLSSQGQRQLNEQAYGGTKVQLSLPDIRQFEVPLVPLDAQRNIVQRLDREIAKIDELIAKTERFIELTQERRAALITAAVTGQIDVVTEGAA